MLAPFIITFREVFEMILILIIIVSYLHHIKQERHYKIVVWAVLSGVLLSGVIGYILFSMYGGFSGTSEAVFEGIVMIIAGILVTLFVLWICNNSDIGMHIKKQVKLKQEQSWAIFLLVFLNILREGIE